MATDAAPVLEMRPMAVPQRASSNLWDMRSHEHADTQAPAPGSDPELDSAPASSGLVGNVESGAPPPPPALVAREMCLVPRTTKLLLVHAAVVSLLTCAVRHAEGNDGTPRRSGIETHRGLRMLAGTQRLQERWDAAPPPFGTLFPRASIIGPDGTASFTSTLCGPLPLPHTPLAARFIAAPAIKRSARHAEMSATHPPTGSDQLVGSVACTHARCV